MRVNLRDAIFMAGLYLLPYLLIAQPSGHPASFSGSGMRMDEIRQPEEIRYSGSSSALLKSNDPSGKYCKIVIPGHHFTSETGKPELPVYSRIIEVPQGMRARVFLSEIESSKISFADHKMKGLLIYPSQPSKTKNEIPDEKVVIIDKKTYETRGIISHDTVVIDHIGTFRGTEFLNVAVYPAFYNPSDGSVDLITSLKLNIEYEDDPSKGTFSELYAQTKSNEGSKDYITGYTDKPVSMVIITDPLFRKALEPLVYWKTQKGIKIKTIYRKPGPIDNVFAYLKDTLTTVYRNSVASGNPVQYLLIVGDLSFIPASRGTTNISDLYYGEFDGEGDYIPELFIGRLPVKDTTQLKGIVKKIIDYESFNYSPSNSFWSGALTTAGNDAGYQNLMNGQVNYIYDNYFDPDPTIKGYRWRYPESPLKDDSLKILFNNGLSILNYTGHGDPGGLSDPSFKVAMVSGLTNSNRYPLIISNACRTAQINVTPCFGTEIVNVSGKGALAFIGCTNDSYWSEDFYWAVGPGTPGLTATFGNTGAGAFDRLFHTHNEEPGEWFYTLGQINFAGNLAVSSSTSSRKKYYWETYILLGDPSLSLYIGKPDTFNISVPDSLPVDIPTLNFFAKPLSYAAISDFDTLWDAKFITPSGIASLTIPPGIKDSCLLMVTGQNMLPYRKTIHFGPVSGEFLITENIIFDDSGGNNNGIPDFGEKINLKMTVKNIGEGDAVDLTANLTLLSGMITVEQGSAYIGTLVSGGSYNISSDFIFNVSDEVTDGEMASLLLTLTDGLKVFNFGLEMTLHAPDLKIISSVPDDSQTGNSNFLPDPGESIMIDVRIANRGSSSAGGTLSINETTPYLSIISGSADIGILEPGTEKVISFAGVISPDAVAGTVLPFEINLDCGKYYASGSYSLATGKTRETWEYNRFDVFPWKQSALYPWVITSSSSYENFLSARTPLLPDKNESVLAITVNTPEKDTVSFYSRISTEDIYDEMIFRIDSVENMVVSGEIPWGKKMAVLESGVHYLEWVYKKDVSLSGGLDAVWIDMITFPAHAFLEADLHIDTVFAPQEPITMNNIIIRGRIINLGRNTLTSFPLAYKINNSEPVNETFFLKIEPGDSLDVAFSAPVNLKPDITYRIEIINRLPEDSYQMNDTAYTIFLKTDINDPGIPPERLMISPNPFERMINIDYESFNMTVIEIEVIDFQGQTVLRRSEGVIPGINRISVDGAGLSRGIYTVRISDEGKTVTRKVVKG